MVLDVVVAVVVVAVLVVEVAGALSSSHVAAGRQRHDDGSSNEQSLVKRWPFLALPGQTLAVPGTPWSNVDSYWYSLVKR